MDRLNGRVLWYNDRDGNGIIEDAEGNELYFDISVLVNRAEKIKRGDRVSFIANESIKECLCAKQVSKN